MADNNEILKRIRILTDASNLDERYGVWDSIADANANIPESIRGIGLTVGIVIVEDGVSKVKEYWWESNTSDEGLVLKGKAALKEDVTTTTEVGASEANSLIPLGTSFTDYIKLIHQKVFNPTFVNPSFSLDKSVNSLQVINNNITFNLTFSFDRGQIRGNIVGGIWNPNTFQDSRAGVATEYTIDSTTQSGSVLQVTKNITIGNNVYSASVEYAEGPQPLDSLGEDFSSPLASGTSDNVTTTIEGVFPIFATTSSISVSTEQSLLSMISSNNIQKNLVAESGGNKQYFDIPNAWLNNRSLTTVQFFNTVSDAFDSSNQLNSFTESATTHIIEGETIDYTRFTNNGPDRGEIKIKLIF